MRFLIYFIILTLNSTGLYAQAAKTICNGSWNSNSIWENNHHPEIGDSIIINHHILNIDTIFLDLNTLIIQSGAVLCGEIPILLSNNSTINIYGKLCAYSFIGGDSILISGGQVNTHEIITTPTIKLINGADLLVSSQPFNCFNKPDCTPAIKISNDGLLISNTEASSYKWFLNGFELTKHTKSIQPKHNGTYQVKNLSYDGILSEFSSKISIDTLPELTLKIGPNPTNKFVSFEYPRQDLNILLYNDKGQKCSFQTSLNELKYTLDFTELSNGIYTLLISTSYKSITKKIVINQ